VSLRDAWNLTRESCPWCWNRTRSAVKCRAAPQSCTGLAEGTPVVAGAGDQAASAVGNGIVESGLVSCTVGTSGVVFAYTPSPAYDPAGRVHNLLSRRPGAWHVMVFTQGAGLSLQWFRKKSGANRQL
jgi:xylulokinase